MIRMSQFKEFSQESDEGKLLLAALAILTSINTKHITDGKWGGDVHPDDAFERIVELANTIYHEEEWKLEKAKIERDKKISQITNDTI